MVTLLLMFALVKDGLLAFISRDFDLNDKGCRTGRPFEANDSLLDEELLEQDPRQSTRQSCNSILIEPC